MPASSIKPSDFYSCPAEKTNFNWFAFELACELNGAIPKELKAYLAKHRYPQEAIDKSCATLAKLLQEVVLRRLRKEIPEMLLCYTDVEKAFPHLNDGTISKLLTCTEEAWGSLLDVCSVCPVACVTHKDAISPKFDAPMYNE